MTKVKIHKIIRTRRRTIGLEVGRDTTLTVRAPEGIDIRVIEEVVAKKLPWIKRKQEYARNRRPSFPVREFVNGEGFLYLGTWYRLHIVPDQDVPLRFETGFYLSSQCVSCGREVLTSWYKEQAKEKVQERVRLYAAKAGLGYERINITNAMKRWGSCGRNGSLNFSWRLIMAPLRVVDYVVVHELAHLEEKGHSPRYWRKVKLMLPDYEKQKMWLRENEPILVL